MASTVAGILLTGIHASRPSSGVSVGTLYSCTTHSLVYQTSDTGSTWATWASLTGTGSVATDTIWDAAGDLAVGSGADTATKLAKGSAGATLAMGNGSVIWNAGTSFPGSKATNDRYFRTDLGMDAYWDGTRWVTAQLFREPFGTANTFTPDTVGTALGRMALWGTAFDLWIVNWDISTFVSGTNTGSAFWTLNFNKHIANDSATVVDTFDTSADSGSVWVKRRRAVGVSVAGTGTIQEMSLTAGKTSTPGGLYWASAIEYRLILT